MARIKVANRAGEDGIPADLDSSPSVSILNSLLGAGIRIRHDCGGKALCGTCAVRVLSGAKGLSPIGSLEAERLAAGRRPDGIRLGCQAHAVRDINIEVVLD